MNALRSIHSSLRLPTGAPFGEPELEDASKRLDRLKKK